MLVLRSVAAVGIGAAVGFVVWRRLGGLIEPFLTNLTVTPSDPVTLAVAGGVLVATALIACLVPVLGTARDGR